MGIVIRQSFWSSGLIYLGVAIGYINTLLLLPYFMDIDQVGLIRLIQSNGMMLLPLAIVGMNGSYLKYFPQFKDDPDLKFRIFSFQLIVILAASILFAIFIYLAQDLVKTLFEAKSSLYNRYIYASVIILIAQAVFNYLIAVVWSEFNITIPNFLNEVLLRILILLNIVFFGMGLLNFQMLILFIVLSYILLTITLYLYLVIKYGFRFDWKFYKLDKGWIRKNFGFGGYTMLITTSSSIIMNVSYLLTSSMVGLEANGILIISVFISTIIELPKRVIVQIISPFITQNFNDNQLQKIDSNYKRSSINLGLVSFLLAIGIITNLKELYLFIPKGNELSEGFEVIVILAFARILGMVSSVSSEILTYSKYYRLNIIITGISALLMIGMNLWLIPVYGILGVGLSILISTAFTNIIKMVILYLKYQFSPFTLNHLYLVLISLATYYLIDFFPLNFDPVINILIRSAITTFLFVLICYFTKISYEMNSLIDKGLRIFKLNN